MSKYTSATDSTVLPTPLAPEWALLVNTTTDPTAGIVGIIMAEMAMTRAEPLALPVVK